MKVQRIKILLSSLIALMGMTVASGQSPELESQEVKELYVYWGWNRSQFGTSDITFEGDGYKFTLADVEGRDRPSEFDVDPYFNPGRMTIPQYNFRVGYRFSEHWDVSVGIDHMKYVMRTNQLSHITGSIKDPLSPYVGDYQDDEISLSPDFLVFEHTDGLNYANVALRRSDNLISFGRGGLSLTEGLELGLLIPRSNVTLMHKERYDEFHLAGGGLSAMIGLNFRFLDRYFIQSELKGGYINMPDVRTTPSTSDKASQSFFFGQFNWVLGANFPL